MRKEKDVKPLISVVIPVFNVEKYIERCIESVRNQTIKDIEIILVDDESPDNCPEICDNYSVIDSRIKVIHKKNEGLGYARNAGMEVAEGKYIAFVDSDDYISKDRFEKMYNKIENAHADVCLEGMKLNHSGKIKTIMNPYAGQLFVGDKVRTTLLPALIGKDSYDRNYVGMSVCRGLYKRDVIIKNNVEFSSEREYVSEDLIFDLELYKYINSAIMSEDAGYYYWKNDSSLTHSNSLDKIDKFDYLYNTVLNLVQYYENNKELIQRMQFTHLFNYKSVLESLVVEYPMKKAVKVCKMVSQRKVIEQVLSEYPIKHLPLQKKLFGYAMKKHCGKLIYLLIRIRNRVR